MSNLASPELPKLKTSQSPVIQKSVDEQKVSLEKKFPNLNEEALNRYARDKVAARLKLNKRAGETAKAKEESGIDSLTGFHNRRWLMEQLRMRIAEANRRNKPFKFIMIDLDHFKWINDGYGHQTGDQILKMLRSIPTREEEPICRMGGEEFGQILEFDNGDKLQLIASRYMESVKDLSNVILRERNPIPNAEVPEILKQITLSIGIAEYTPGTSVSAEELIDTADKGVYYSKQNGRNKAVFATKISKNSYDFKEVNGILI